MMFGRLIVCGTLIGLAASPAASPTLELRGRILPPRRAAVIIYASGGTFHKQKVTDHQGRFRFKKLIPGTYSVTLFHPRRGEMRRTIEVTPSFADDNGRVEVTLRFRTSEQQRKEMVRRRNTVSIKELSISREAWSEFRKARGRFAKNDIEAAKAHLERAIDVSPQFMAAWNFLGTIAHRAGEFEQAETYFRRALDEDPDAFPPNVNLGGALLALGRYEEALDYNRYSVALRPNDPLANGQAGLNYFYLGDAEAAERYLRATKRLDPTHVTAPQLTLAEIYSTRGDQRKAFAELRDFVRRRPDTTAAERIREMLAQAPADHRGEPEANGLDRAPLKW